MAYDRDDRSGGFSGGGFNRGGDRGGRGGFGGGRSSFGEGRGGFGRGGDRGDRPMYTATCSNCGKECQVPFRPTNGKPVYCSDCFEKMGNGGRNEERRDDRPSFRPQAPSFDSKAQLDAINAKLDRILGILAPAPVIKEEKIIKVVDEVKPEKAKKVVKKVASEKKK
jgi:CxxC-x17-CxxC domain-containing protein